MSVGAFIGIRPSFNDEVAAEAFLNAIERALGRARLPSYTEPRTRHESETHPRFGRSELDHHGAGALAELARRAEEGGYGVHLSLIASNPYRVAFLPIEFPKPLETEYSESIGGKPLALSVGSVHALLRELNKLAPALGIPLAGDTVSDRTSELINEGRGVDDGDESGELLEDERSAWLLLHEGARLAIRDGAALSLAG